MSSPTTSIMAANSPSCSACRVSLSPNWATRAAISPNALPWPSHHSQPRRSGTLCSLRPPAPSPSQMERAGARKMRGSFTKAASLLVRPKNLPLSTGTMWMGKKRLVDVYKWGCQHRPSPVNFDYIFALHRRQIPLIENHQPGNAAHQARDHQHPGMPPRQLMEDKRIYGGGVVKRAGVE